MQGNQDPSGLEVTYTVEEVAKWLKISTRTLYRYIDLNIIEKFYEIELGGRVYRLFTQGTIDQFRQKYGKNFEPEAKPKRAYHRTKKKWQRQTAKKKTA